MELYYWDSPHKQIFEDFEAEVIKVHDGDTITVKWQERDFNFPVRFSNISAPELNESGGAEAQSWLESQILGENVVVRINPKNRVEKWGRLLGTILHRGLDMGEAQIIRGISTPWEKRNDGKIQSKFSRGF